MTENQQSPVYVVVIFQDALTRPKWSPAAGMGLQSGMQLVAERCSEQLIASKEHLYNFELEWTR